MRLLFRKSNHFLLNRWTVPWALTFTLVSFERRQFVTVLFNHLVRFFICVSHVTVQQLVWRLEVLPFVHKAEWLNDRIRGFNFSDRQVNTRSVETWRGASRASLDIELKPFQSICKSNGWWFSISTVPQMSSSRVLNFPDMNHAAQESSSGDYKVFRVNFFAIFSHNPLDVVGFIDLHVFDTELIEEYLISLSVRLGVDLSYLSM